MAILTLNKKKFIIIIIVGNINYGDLGPSN